MSDELQEPVTILAMSNDRETASTHIHPDIDRDTHSEDGEVESNVSAKAADQEKMNPPGDPLKPEHSLGAQSPQLEQTQGASTQENIGQAAQVMNSEGEDESGKFNLAAGPVEASQPDQTPSSTLLQPHLFSSRPVRSAGPNVNAVQELGPGRVTGMLNACDELNNFLDQIAAKTQGVKVTPTEAGTLCNRLLKLSGALTERLNAVRYLGLAGPYEEQCASLRTECETHYKELSSLTMTAPPQTRTQEVGAVRPKEGSEKNPPRKPSSDTRLIDTVDTANGVKYNHPKSDTVTGAQNVHRTDPPNPTYNVEGFPKREAAPSDDEPEPKHFVGRGGERHLVPRDERERSKAAVSKDKLKYRARNGEYDSTKLTQRQASSRSSSKASSRSSLSSRRRLEYAEVMALKAKREALSTINEIRQRELEEERRGKKELQDIKNDLERAELDAEIAVAEARAKALDETQSIHTETDALLCSLSKLDRVTDLFLERDDGVTQEGTSLGCRSGIKDPSMHVRYHNGQNTREDSAVRAPQGTKTSAKTVKFDIKRENPHTGPQQGSSPHDQLRYTDTADGSANVHGLGESTGRSHAFPTEDHPVVTSSTSHPTFPGQNTDNSLGVNSIPNGAPVMYFEEHPPKVSGGTPLNVHSATFQPRYASTNSTVAQLHQPCHHTDTVDGSTPNTAPLSGQALISPQTESTLAKSIADAMSISRLPVPKPSVFSGDPLEYPAWSASFQHLVRNDAVTPEDKMLILRDYISGPAKEAVGDLYFNLGEASYKSALEILRRRFGEDYTVAEAMKNKLDTWPEVKFKDTVGLRRYADYLRQCLVMSREISGLSVLNDPAHIKTLSHKLPDGLALSWGKKVAENKAKYGIYPSLGAFVSFLERQADALFEADLQAKPRRPPQDGKVSNSKHSGGQSYAVGLQGSDDKHSLQRSGELENLSHVPNAKRCTFCDNNHYIQDCERFLKETYEARKSVALRKRLCFKCLRPGHSARGCVVRVQCKECKAKHVTAMHDPKFRPASALNPPIPYGPDETPPKVVDSGHKMEGEHGGKKATAHMTTREAETHLYSLYMPVYISSASNPSKEELVYAMLDTMSDTSFLTDSMMDALELETRASVLALTTLTSVRSTFKCRAYSDLRVRAADSDQVIHVPLVYSQSDFGVDKRQIPTNEIVRSIPHLCHLSSSFSPLRDAPVALLLGVNAAEALKPLEVVSGEPGQPYALRTKLGWGLVGEVASPTSTETENAESEGCFKSSCEKTPVAFNSTRCFRIKDNTNERLIELIERDFTSPVESPMSQDDHKFLEILSAGIKLNPQGHYEMPLPFRDGNPQLPNNRHIALRRLNGLKRKFLESPEHFKLYREFVNEMLIKQDAEQVPREEIDADSVWYIPHHGVYNPNKPGKIRVVFDCAARSQNVSLNDCLLTGPDLLNSLVGVLCRFRLCSVAVSCDIERMFHQFCVAPEQRDYLRFLWWPNDDLTAAPVDFRMRVHLFGAASSPGCANFGLKTLARDHQTVSTEASEFIQEDFYVDDGLGSRDNDEEAIELLKGARAICEKGNLHLHKIASNSMKVSSAFPESEVVKSCTPVHTEKKSEVSIERALGVRWTLANDALHFLHVPKETPTTKRGVLSAVASIFDPLGLVSPVILKGRQILQETCRLGIDWDDSLPSDLLSRWNDWISDVKSLSDIQIPRCYTPAASRPWKVVELHHFADASTKGYGECSYLRIVDNGGRAHSALVMAKSKVAPLRAVTVPRLELQAAVLAVKIAQFLERELHRLHVQHRFWTDSRVVLGYVYNEAKRFHTFVANRLQQIRDFSRPQQWHHVDTDQNPADHASRGLSVESMKASNWQTGPEFLRQDKIVYAQVNASIAEDDKEVKVLAVVSSKETLGDAEEIIKRFSSLRRLLRVVWLILRWRQLVGKLKTRHGPHEAFTPEARKEVLHSVVRRVQQLHFPETSRATNPQLLPLNAFIDEEGLLRVGGRLSESVEDFQIKHPLILPQDSHLSLLVVRYYHEKVHHSGRTLTIGSLQTNGYWVCGARKIVDAVIHRCVPCTKRRGKPMTQRMADLPSDRMEVAPPFTNTGLDCFGPFIVKEGRRNVKRYGLILTCLVSRAIHLEVLEDMTTDAFICGLRRFIALRGNVKLIRCDRGTNFIGAERELREARRKMNDAKVVDEMSERDCKFLFNPPTASHFGGVWERMIRIVRQILSELIDGHSGRLTSDALATLFHEVASIVNNRPLCPSHLQDPTSCVPLTPNHLLTLRPEPVFPPPGNFTGDDMYARKRWRRVQFLASQFWVRWKREYLPTLQSRKKWFLQKDSVKPGMLVLMTDEAAPRGVWKTARVEKIYPSSDGLVRSVQLRRCSAQKDAMGRLVAQTSFMDRPIHKLVPLNIKTH